MRALLPARMTMLSLLFLSAASPALAVSGQILSDAPQQNTTVQQDIQATSGNTTAVIQQAGDTAAQNAAVTGSAATIVHTQETVDTRNAISLRQNCGSATGSGLCIQEAAPQVHTIAEQVVNAVSQNIQGVAQRGGSGSVQNTAASGTAITQVTAAQTVTPETVISIFQNCSQQTGVCVQRALPDVLTAASQVIAAKALNNLEIIQQGGTGSTQQAAADLVAHVQVSAEQVVSPRTFLSLTQLCAVDVGLCIQRAIPLVQTAVQQVIDAQTRNTAVVDQTGGSLQNAAIQATANTQVTSTQQITATNTIQLLQRCGVRQGLCLQVDASGNPFYVFSDGHTTATGSYRGTLDETPLQHEYSRSTVGGVAGGICDAPGSCSRLQQLLVWLFGPEPALAPAAPVTLSDASPGNASPSRHGHQTDVLAASLHFLADKMQDGLRFTSLAFNGDERTLRSNHRALFCSMRAMLPDEDADPGIWDWTATQLSQQTGIDLQTAIKYLHDPSLCAQTIAQAQPVAPTPFPIAMDGPLSSNALWNKCIRGQYVSPQDIKANPDHDSQGHPKSCGSYYSHDIWTHPDLGIEFYWDSELHRLGLPNGYVVSMTGRTDL